MSDSCCFNESFHDLPLPERVACCQNFEKQARALAKIADSAIRAKYLQLAEQWASLGREFERSYYVTLRP